MMLFYFAFALLMISCRMDVYFSSSIYSIRNISLSPKKYTALTHRIASPLISTLSIYPTSNSILSNDTAAPRDGSSTNKRLRHLRSLLLTGGRDTPNNKLIVIPQPGAGFCNSLRGLRCLTMYALTHGFKLRIRWPNYFAVMHPDLIPLRDTEDMNCRYINDFISVIRQNQTITGCNIVFLSYDITGEVLKNPIYKQNLFNLSLFDNPTNDPVYRRLFTSFFFRPSDEIIYEGDRILTLMKGNNTVAVQVRTGGQLAASKENVKFFTEDLFFLIPQYITKLVNYRGLKNPMVFLSTDSTVVYNYLNSTLPFPLMKASVYSIGHTSSRSNIDIINHFKRAILDLYVLSRCQHLLVTCMSSFGAIALDMSISGSKVVMKYS